MSKELYTIKFSHYYLKMGGLHLFETFTVVRVEATDYNSLSDTFIDYDTEYWDNENHLKKYNLPKGQLIIIFLAQSHQLMTTIRRYTVDKFHFYSSLVGKEVIVKIVEAGKKE